MPGMGKLNGWNLDPETDIVREVRGIRIELALNPVHSSAVVIDILRARIAQPALTIAMPGEPEVEAIVILAIVEALDIPAQIVIERGSGIPGAGSIRLVLGNRGSEHIPVLFKNAKIGGIASLAIAIRVIAGLHIIRFQHGHRQIKGIGPRMQDLLFPRSQAGNRIRATAHTRRTAQRESGLMEAHQGSEGNGRNEKRNADA